ncbi:unnamed protein product [Cyclocybe aegerita]|uniref:Uncharacterized protein n=1 Tax=Cyclocybe aegerita TaxID=1973307 RepID=A0A8S0VS01_CYCAE|nr:unnamed protein product [Cyclocybe aegerita]
MSCESTNLSSLARSKLHNSFSAKEGCSLHRWVLLKNSILLSPSVPNSATSSTQAEVNPAYPVDDGEDDDDAVEVTGSVDSEAFVFPDAEKLATPSKDVKSEAQWLDSLLETLGDDDDDDDFRVDTDDHHNPSDISVLPVDDDDFSLYSPTVSPMSSSDDLPSQPDYYSSPISVPYPVPYPPLIHAYHFDSPFDPLVSPVSSPYEDPLPYHDLDDIEDLPVPDAIEDTSDDESDAPTTPSLGRSSSSLSLVDAASVPLPQERSRLRHPIPRVYVDSDSYFYSFQLDPLPFPDQHLNSPYNHYQEC